MRIGVIGPGGEGAGHDDLTAAEEIGRLLGAAGATIYRGGLGGVMEAVCRGASEFRAVTVGFLPGRDDIGANPYLTAAVPTGLGELAVQRRRTSSGTVERIALLPQRSPTALPGLVNTSALASTSGGCLRTAWLSTRVTRADVFGGPIPPVADQCQRPTTAPVLE